MKELRTFADRAVALRASGMKVAAMAAALRCSQWKISQALNFHDRLARDELRRSQRESADPERVPHRRSLSED